MEEVPAGRQPAERDAAPPPRDASDRDALARLRLPDAARRTVLVVEDIEEHRYLFAHLLRATGYQVLEARDGVEAVVECSRSRPDLVLLDLGIPGLDGYQVIQILKGERSTRDIPIIAVTVHAFERDVARAIALGCARHLAKPALPRDVVRAVHEVLGLSAGPGA